jgi:hypothetical protein
MKKIYYEKVGRRYKPVAEYDSTYLDSFPKGAHLVMCYPGGSTRRFNIDPDYAALLAASRVAEEAMSKAIQKASEMRPHHTPVTEKQKKAWENLSKAFGSDRYYIEIPSAKEIAEAGIKALQDEAMMLYSTNEPVKKALAHLLLIAKLTKEIK